MQITFTARHFEMTDGQRRHAEQELNRLNRYIDHILSAEVIIVHEKHGYQVELNWGVDGTILTSKDEDAELFVAVDKAAAKLERQLKKRNDKLHDHHPKGTV